MVQILHGCAKTTQATHRELQDSEEGVRALARRLGLNRRTVSRWSGRDSVHDLPMGPRNRRSRVLSPAQEALCVLYRRRTGLPLDDCRYWLRNRIPHLSRSTLHRCFQRHRISRLPEPEGVMQEKRKKFRDNPIGYFHIDMAEVGTGEGRLQLFVAIDRTCKYVHAEVHGKRSGAVAVAFPCNLIAAVPCRIHTILTDNGVRFTNRIGGRRHSAIHDFEKGCRESGVEHRLTKVYHPWTNGQVERINRTLGEATVKRCFFDSHEKFGKTSAGFPMRAILPGISGHCGDEHPLGKSLIGGEKSRSGTEQIAST